MVADSLSLPVTYFANLKFSYVDFHYRVVNSWLVQDGKKRLALSDCEMMLLAMIVIKAPICSKLCGKIPILIHDLARHRLLTSEILDEFKLLKARSNLRSRI